MFFGENYEKKHFGTISESDIFDRAENKIFPQITVYPEMIEKLSEKTIMIENSDKAEEYMLELLSKSGVKDVIGKRRAQKAAEKFSTDLGNYPYSFPDKTYVLTLYDVLSYVAKLDEFGIVDKEVTKKNLAENVHRIYQNLAL
jgi:hypothetical protein